MTANAKAYSDALKERIPLKTLQEKQISGLKIEPRLWLNGLKKQV
mgnify:CR=1 FL=1